MASFYNTSAPPPYTPTGGIVGGPQFTNPVQKVELKISCRNLLDMDFFSKSDPFVVVYNKPQSGNWREIGRTETIMDNLNPDFVKSFILDYFFEEQQLLKFDVYDLDSNSRDLTKHDFIGKFVTSLGSIIGEHNGRVEQPLQVATAKDTEHGVAFSRTSLGTIIVRSEEVSNCKDSVTLHLCGKKLDKKDFFGKSDPYLEFQRCNEDNTYTTVFRTEVIKNTLDPNWKPFSISAQVLCNGDYDRNLRVLCYDWNSNGDVDLIGLFDVTLGDLKNFRSGRPNSYDLINPRKLEKKKKKYKNSGVIYIQNCHVEEKSTFLDFLRGGLELNFVVAIDFTASNGNPSQIDSLHYNTPQQPSQYVQALQAVGGIIEDYDSDKLFPAFGFGAKLPPNWNVSHSFALNFNPNNPDCNGVSEIIAAYYHTIGSVALYGPTNFAPIINNTASIARQTLSASQPGSQYFVLLIITDGIITDMEKTKEALVNAAKLPLSIIIVGVGNANFDAMEELDGDDVRVSYRGVAASRDIVQFVPFRDYLQGNRYNPSSGVKLAKDVLQELPDQVIEYMEQNKIKANPPPAYM